MIRVGIVAGETSGDLLGAGLMRAIREQEPTAVFEGIAGPQMIKEGCNALVPSERLAIMGLFEVLGRYRELRRHRSELVKHFLGSPPDVFIGIDAPDFNIGVEAKLRRAGIKTVHYVSPSVWAWRQYRIKKIARAVDLMLTLFPFEAEFYHRHHIMVRFVGHPLADMIDIETDMSADRKALGLPDDKKIIALLPGSRIGEVSRMADLFVQTAMWCAERHTGLYFVVPFVNVSIRKVFEGALARHCPGLPITLLDGQSHQAMSAADVVLLASGTATLEALLFKKPMVVAYKMNKASYWLISKMLKVDQVALPNLLAGKQLVPEYIQNSATPENLGQALLDYLGDPERVRVLKDVYTRIHQELSCDASRQAANAVLSLVKPDG